MPFSGKQVLKFPNLNFVPSARLVERLDRNVMDGNKLPTILRLSNISRLVGYFFSFVYTEKPTNFIYQILKSNPEILLI